MENIKYKSSILLAIFKRNGGEGALTKIMKNENLKKIDNQLEPLSEIEEPLICYKQDIETWVLLTNLRIIEKKKNVIDSILYSALSEVNLAIQEEFKNGVTNKQEFTRLNLKTIEKRDYLIKFEKGAPYQGIYQMLHHIVSKTQHRHSEVDRS